jgi:C4-dicarboxylate-specific signal transduction histidine kinase
MQRITEDIKEDGLRDAAESGTELSQRVACLEELRDGLLQMLKDLDRSEHALQGAYSELKRSQARLIQASKMTALGELSAVVAHELSQPVAVVKGLTQNMLRTTSKDDPSQQKLKLIEDAVKRMEEISCHLKAFSRPEAELRDISLNSVVNDSLILLKELISSKGIALRLCLGPVHEVRGSATRLEQVIINLAVNSVDAMKDGGTLTISTYGEGPGQDRYSCLKMSDTGMGIPDEDIKRVFEPFFTTKAHTGGTGLGLSICRDIIKEHKGEICVESKAGSGTAFTIKIPSSR